MYVWPGGMDRPFRKIVTWSFLGELEPEIDPFVLFFDSFLSSSSCQLDSLFSASTDADGSTADAVFFVGLCKESEAGSLKTKTLFFFYFLLPTMPPQGHHEMV
jgi:hypothetical protein